MQLIIGIFVFISVVHGSSISIPNRQNNEEDNLRQLLAREDDIEKFIRRFPFAVQEDAHLKVPELLEKYGYPVESYSLTTSDNYILKMHRIPYGKDGPSANRPVVYLQHGLLSSSADFITPGPGKGFAYLLADEGYDVWMGNARGNRYSRNHTTLSPDKDKKKFWNFSWHEIGLIDVPTFIDFVLDKTQEQQVFYIGHSQGTTAFYVMCSEKPEYNKKIRAHISLAPIAYMSHVESPLIRIAAVAEVAIDPLLKLIGMHEFVPTDGFVHNATKLVCKGGPLQILCKNSLFLVSGFNEAQLNMTLVPIMMGHTPAGASSKQLLHYSQGINSGKFRQYNHGLLGNLIRYRRLTPPDYNLDKVTAPVYLLYSKNDWLAAEIDVLKLYEELPNAEKFIIADDKWNHLDYVIGIDAPTLVYDKVFALMKGH